MRGAIITFYSYKGGTGRSMAVANTAWILASNGLRVLTVDWDLEAPGLHRYFHPFLSDGDLKLSRGIVDLVWEFAAAAVDPDAPDDPDWHQKFAEISPYAMSLEYDFPGRGTVDFVPAGRQDATYSALVSSFDWENFYERLGGGGFLEALKRNMRDGYDYVLIDSRTGLSDTAGICTVQLPDILVNCFSLSTQAIDGAAAVAASVGRQRRNGQVRIFPVPMRVEDGEQDKLDAGRDYARSRFGRFLTHVPDPELYWGQVEVPYKSFYAYEEILATIGDRPRQENTVLSATERIVGYLTSQRVTALEAVPPESERRELLTRFQRTKSDVLSSHVGGTAPRVFISYAYESAEHFEAVRELWFLLRSHGVDARMDFPPNQRPSDWTAWLLEQLRAAGLVLVVVSPTYRRFADRDDATGDDREPGPEALLVRDAYRSGLSVGRLLPVVLPGCSVADTPEFLFDVESVIMTDLDASGIGPLLRQALRHGQHRESQSPGVATQQNQSHWSAVRAESPRQAAVLQALAAGERRQLRRVLNDSALLPVRWSLVSSGSGPPRGVAKSTWSGRRGTPDEFAEMYLGLSNRKLVVLGALGSGKSTLIYRLVLDMLARWDDGPVPTLLSATSWRPEIESFRSWILQQLRLHLGVADSFEQEELEQVLAAGLIVPVVDDLDELPTLLRNIAFLELFNRWPVDIPTVVTCRIENYEEMVTTLGYKNSRDAIIELSPLNAEDISRHLSVVVLDRDAWSPVFRELREHPRGPVAQALSTPEMLHMAREVYSDTGTNLEEPIELLRFSARLDVENHLLDSFIPATWDRSAQERDTRRKYRPALAKQWLASLAHWMSNHDTRDLVWWRYHQGAKRVAGVRAFLLGVPGGIFVISAVNEFATGLSEKTATQSIFVITVWVGLALGCFGTVLIKPPKRPSELSLTFRPGFSARRFRLRRQIESPSSSSPQDTLRVDRTATVVSGLIWAILSFITVTSIVAALPLTTPQSPVIFGIAVAASALLFRFCTSAWGWYSLVRTWYAARGRLPWRLMRFLEDAHNRGVLRQVGAVYQFRSPRLQDRLAGRR